LEQFFDYEHPIIQYKLHFIKFNMFKKELQNEFKPQLFGYP